MAVVKIIELVGSSRVSTDDAAQQALKQAQDSLRNIRAVDIVSTGIRGEHLDEYRARPGRVPDRRRRRNLNRRAGPGGPGMNGT